MELIFDNDVSPEYDALEDEYRALLSFVFADLGIRTNYEVDVSLVDAETIQTINRDYRSTDRVTDVISFAFEDDKSDLGKIVGDDIPRMLGEIFICVPRCLEQAKEIGNTPKREFRFLFVHGLLHLLGYDHMKPEDEAIMFPLQDRLLTAYEEAHP
ncbi:MAG: rRNA maturation RNase YbeY [Bacilli bacterium]|nr:rRNA maturation RNase YbeY [Bacilli bacterium]